MKGWKDCPDCWGTGAYRGFGRDCVRIRALGEEKYFILADEIGAHLEVEENCKKFAERWFFKGLAVALGELLAQLVVTKLVRRLNA